MGIRSPFAAINNEEKVGSGGVVSAAPIVDHGLGEAYEVVEFVRNNFSQVLAVAGIAVEIVRVSENIENFGDYALVGHDHDDLYQVIGNYQPAGDYAAAGHNHDGVYQPIGDYQPAGNYQLAGEYQAAGDYILGSTRGVANGVATLDPLGKIPTSQIPALAISKPTVVASEAAQLALVAEEGDIVIRPDAKANYIHNGGTAGTMADWTMLESGTANVISVNGQFGTVVLGKADVGLGNVDNTSDANKPVSIAQAAAIGAKENTIVAGTTAQYRRGDKTWQTLDKSAVGLANVDNTSDANKPVSTAQATAIGAKLDANQKGAVSGVAPLGTDSKVPAAYLPAASAGATTLAALTDVNLTGAVTGSVIKFNSVSAKWEVGTDNAGSGGGGSGAVATNGDSADAGQSSSLIAFRYWRISVTAFDGGEQYTALSDLQFRITAGVGTQNTGGTAMSSGSLGGGFAVASAFDGLDGTTYISNLGVPNWVGYDFGVNNDRVIREVSLRSRHDGYQYQFPKDFAVQGSHDGATWITQWSVTGGLYTNGAANTLRREQTANPTVESLVERYPTHLKALVDVDNTAPTDGQTLVWDAALNRWKPGTVAGSTGGGGGTGSTTAIYETPLYTNPLGDGYRRSDIGLVLSGSVTGTMENALVGNLANHWYWNGNAAAIITLTFPKAVRMTAFTHWTDNSGGGGTFQTEGSNDGTTWTAMGDPWTWGGSAGANERAWINTAYYTKYRFRQTAGSTSNAAWQQGFFFKLASKIADISGGSGGYRAGWFFTSALGVSEVILLHSFTKAVTFAANWAGSVAVVDGVAPGAALVVDIQKNNVSVGTLSISTGGVATFTSTGGAAVAFAVGDRMKLVGPATVNTATNVSGTFEGVI